MKQLRKTIRRILLESDEPCDVFMKEMYKRFEKRPGKQGWAERLAKVFPDGCEVHFLLEPIGGRNLYFHEIETIGEDCVRKGYARDTMETIFALADTMGIGFLGEIDPFNQDLDRPDAEELMKFYRSVGFEGEPGDDLYRKPRKQY